MQPVQQSGSVTLCSPVNGYVVHFVLSLSFEFALFMILKFAMEVMIMINRGRKKPMLTKKML